MPKRLPDSEVRRIAACFATFKTANYRLPTGLIEFVEISRRKVNAHATALWIQHSSTFQNLSRIGTAKSSRFD